ncbi:MAG: hypothetical protein H7Y86_10375 [Rhizobacter sp.]|nr:hypothetical protein [Ferruginibacter sp.]
MQYIFHLEQYQFEGIPCQLCVPDYAQLKETYLSAPAKPAMPYWAKLWPSAIALCRFIAARQPLFYNRKVMELAAGLGLPSILAAKFSASVICSDYVKEAVELQQASVKQNGLQNVSCECIDWREIHRDLDAGIILLSDINYDPAQFEILYELLLRLLDKGAIVILSTPQRIIGKPFIEKLLPYCKEKTTTCVESGGENAEIFIMQLEKTK